MALFYAFLIFILLIVLFIGLYHFFKLREYSKKLEKDLKSCKIREQSVIKNSMRNGNLYSVLVGKVIKETDNSDDCNLNIREMINETVNEVDAKNDL